MEEMQIQIFTRTKRFRDKPTAELARLFRKLADAFERDGGLVTRVNGRHHVAALRDSAGKPCGAVQITPDGTRAKFGY